jgi:hypothetical protein
VKISIGPVLIVGTIAALGLMPLAAQAPAARTGIPRTADGKPDLSGIWQTLGTAEVDLQAHQAHKGAPAGISSVEGNDIPYLPAALAKKKENQERGASADPNTRCYLPGVPRIMYMSYPFQILQTPQKLTMLFEYVHAVRYLYTNGTEHPPGHIDWWMGDSRGKWEGDTLVVDNVDFNDQTWFDRAGNYHSDALQVVERFTLTDADHIRYEATITDPKVFSRPWKINVVLYRRMEPNMQVLEYECYAFDHEFHAPIPGQPR